MWMASTAGFFSIVERHPGEFQVRARERADIENAARTKALRGTRWIETPSGDYRYRIVCSHAAAVAFVTEIASRIDYSNFKAAVHATRGQEHKGAPYARVWSIMSALQPGGPYNQRSRQAWHRAEAEPPQWLALAAPTVREMRRVRPMTWKTDTNDAVRHLVPNKGKTSAAECGRRPHGQWTTRRDGESLRCGVCLNIMLEAGRNIL
jgi:hypothetical protein